MPKLEVRKKKPPPQKMKGVPLPQGLELFYEQQNKQAQGAHQKKVDRDPAFAYKEKLADESAKKKQDGF